MRVHKYKRFQQKSLRFLPNVLLLFFFLSNSFIYFLFHSKAILLDKTKRKKNFFLLDKQHEIREAKKINNRMEWNDVM